VTAALSATRRLLADSRVLSCLAREGYLSHYDLGEELARHWTKRAEGEPYGASCVQKSDDSRFCNSHCLSHFAAFFIVVGTKTSTGENLVLV
jgi:hypothetical protein